LLPKNNSFDINKTPSSPIALTVKQIVMCTTSKEKLANTLIEYTHFTSVKYYCELQIALK